MPKDSAQTRPPVVPAPETGAGPSKTRWVVAFLVAAASDVMSYGTALVPPVQWGVDVATALLLFGLPGLALGALTRARGGGDPLGGCVPNVGAGGGVGGPVGRDPAHRSEEHPRLKRGRCSKGDDVPGVLLIMSFAQLYQAVESMYQHM